MKPLIALFSETWWLWTACVAVCGVMVSTISLFFLVLLPMLLVVFFYFAYNRYDRDGNSREQ